MNINKALALAVLISPLAQARAERVTRAQYVMGTVLEIQAEGARADAALSEAFAEVVRWDALLSLYKKESELSRLNASASRAPFACSPDLWRALTGAFEQSRAAGGLFDPTALPLLRRGPQARALVGLAGLTLDAKTRSVSFKTDGMGLTLDAYGKGWALDEAAKHLRRRKVVALMNFGGQILAVGAPAGARGWEVKVPGRERPLILRDASASTSGNSEQPGHIVDPRTGERLLNRPAVTVVARTGAEADAWSTALFVAGPDHPTDRCALFEGRKDAPDACTPYVGAPAAKGAGK